MRTNAHKDARQKLQTARSLWPHAKKSTEGNRRLEFSCCRLRWKHFNFLIYLSVPSPLILPLLTISNVLSLILSLKKQTKNTTKDTCFNLTSHLTLIPSMFTKDLFNISFLRPHSEEHFLLFLSRSSPFFHKSSSVLHKLTSQLTSASHDLAYPHALFSWDEK